MARDVIRSRSVSRFPLFIGGVVLLGLGAWLSARSLVAGVIPLLVGGALVIVGTRTGPAAERIVLDDRGVTDLKLRLGPVPWHEIRSATVVPLGTHFTMIALDLTEPARWKDIKAVDADRLRELAARLDFMLPEVFLYGSGLERSAEEVVAEINRRATAGR